MVANISEVNMRLFIGIIIGFLLSVTIVNAELIVKGKKVIYTGDALTTGITITESEIAPTNPKINDIWRDITDNTVYTYNGTAWVVKQTTPAIKAEIAIFKANITGVTDPKAKACLKSMARILLKIYKESAE